MSGMKGTSTAAAKASRWGDEDEEEDTSPVAAPIQSKGRSRELKIRVPLAVKQRKNLPRFGEAKVGEENVTLLSGDFIAMEHPDDQMDPTAASTERTLANFITKNAERTLRGDRENDGDYDREDPMFAPKGDADNEGPASSGGVARYVAPGARGGATSSGGGTGERDGTENTLRVSNLSKAATEDDLKELFERFGRIHRVSLPKVEDKLGEKVPRGFAYIAFVRRDDAEVAMNALQGYGYDHLVIKIEWAKPTGGGGGGGGGGGNTYRSGYGQKLAQDTTERAVFTSTKN